MRTDRALGGLHPAPPAAVPDVTVRLGTAAPWADRGCADGGLVYRDVADHACPGDALVELAWLEGGAGLRLAYSDGTRFDISADTRDVWATWPEDVLSLEDAATYLLGPVLAYILRRRGVLALHASAVVVDGRAVAFCGDSGAGKSTIAGALAAAGQAVLADDVVALCTAGDGIVALPAYAYLRVWEHSARMLAGEAHGLPRLTPNWDKLGFPVEALGYAVAREAAPLAAVYLLGTRSDDDEPSITVLSPASAFVALSANTSVNYLLDDAMRREEFHQLARLVERTPVYRLVAPSDPARIGDVAIAVTRHVARVRITR